MSVTSELKNKSSDISIYLASIVNKAALNKIINNWNIYLGKQPTIVDYESNPLLVGTAFDYMFRWHVQPLAIDELKATIGASYLNDKKHHQLIEAILKSKGQEEKARASIILSWYEWVYREGTARKEIKNSSSINLRDSLYSLISNHDVHDLILLDSTIDDVWGSRIKKPYTPNPEIPHASLIGGGDADWIFNSILYDCKTSRVKKPMKAEHIYQIIAYVLMDWDNELNLKGIGWYYARQKTIIEYEIDKFISDISDKRENMKQVITRKYNRTKSHDFVNIMTRGFSL